MAGIWKCAGWSLLSLLLPFAVLAADTNAPAPGAPAGGAEPVAAEPSNSLLDSLRDKPSRARLEKELNRSRGISPGSLDALNPPVTPPQQQQLTPAQVRKIKERLDEERYWMFDPQVGTSNRTEKSSQEEKDQEFTDASYTTGMPKPLKRFFENADAKSGRTNAVRNAEERAEAAAPKAERPGSLARSLLGLPQAPGQSAPAGGVFSQLFQTPASGDQPVTAPPPSALSATSGSSISGLTTEQRLTSLQSYSQAAASAPLAPAPTALPQAAPSAMSVSSLSGMNSLSGLGSPTAPKPPSFALPGSSPSGPTPSALSQPIQFTPVGLPKRSF